MPQATELAAVSLLVERSPVPAGFLPALERPLGASVALEVLAEQSHGSVRWCMLSMLALNLP
jgi:hypothetical protein